MACSLPGSSVHGLLQARILEWVASSFSRGSSRPRDQTQVSYIAGRLFTDWSSREVPFINLVRTLIANKSPYSQSYGFSSSHVGMWELDHKEGWAQKNWCFQSVVLEKTLESRLDCEEIKSVNPKGNQHWIFIQKTETEAAAPILWPSWCKELTHWKRPWC